MSAKNETVKLLETHKCTRGYTEEPVAEPVLDEIIESAHLCASSVNGQQVSVIVIRNKATKDTIAELCGGQPWIAAAPVFLLFVADYRKTDIAVAAAGAKQVIHESLEGWSVAAVDAGIMLEAAMVSARSFGLGVCPIGAVRREPQKMIDLLGLPHLTFPMVGLTVGHPTEQAAQGLTKPRLPVSTYRHDERYDESKVTAAAVKAYDQTLEEHWAKVGRKEGTGYTTSIAQFYQQVYFPKVQPVAKSQGFVAAEK